MNIRGNNKGMTAVEMLIAISILSLLAMGVFTMLWQCLTGWGNSAATEVANSNASIALQKLSFEIREARSATLSGGQLVVTFPLVHTDPVTGEKLYDTAANDPVTSTYYVSGGNLVRLRNGNTQIIARGISTESTFTAAAGYVDVVLVSSKQLGRCVKKQQVTGHITLRNSNI